MEIVFWIAALGLAYVFMGYPALLWLAAKLRPRPWRTRPGRAPRVSILIAAHDEAETILGRIENCLKLNYPPDCLEVVVSSDGSTDGLDRLVAEHPDARVKLVAGARREGKLAALNRAVPAAAGEVLVFSDANSAFHPDAVARLAAGFEDERVGCVAGRKVIRPADPGAPAQPEGQYWNYENFVKYHESLVHSAIGADGSIYALRRELYPFPDARAGYSDDFYISLSILARGYRIVYEPDAVVYEPAASTSRGEFRRKIRTLSGGLEVMRALWRLLLPFASPVWWQLWSHRLLRFAVPYWLIAVLVASAALAGRGPFYALAFAGQVLAYAAALAEALGFRSKPGRWAFRLTLMNFVLVPALVRFLTRKTEVTWDKVGR